MNTNIPPIRIVGTLDQVGYGYALRGNLEALRAVGLGPEQIRVMPATTTMPIDGLLRADRWLDPYLYGDPIDDKINIVHLNPALVGTYHTSVGGRYNIAVCAWETNQLPRAKHHASVGAMPSLMPSSPFQGDAVAGPKTSAILSDMQADLKERVEAMDICGLCNGSGVTAEGNPCPHGCESVAPIVQTVVGNLNRFDEIWVPSNYVKWVFEESGVTSPVYVIPHVLPTKLLELPPKKPTPRKEQHTCHLYHIGSWNARKDPETLVRAYWSCGWTPTDRVRLLMHLVPPNRTDSAVYAHQEMVRGRLSDLKRVAGPGGEAQLGLLTTPRSFDWILRLHMQCDIFCTASHGEGFGAGIDSVIAVAMGNYVIGGGGPALEDLEDQAPEAVISLPKQEVQVTPMPEYEGYELNQTWWQVQPQDLSGAIRETVAQLQEGLVEGPPTEEIERVRKYYGPGNVGKMMLKRLEAVG